MITTKKIFFSAFAVFALIAVLVVCFSINAQAAVSGKKMTFIIRGQEYLGEYIDEIDSRGYRHIEFISDVPIDMSNYAVAINVDAPVGENIKVIDDEETLEKFGCFANGVESSFEAADNEIYYYTRKEIIPVSENPADDRIHEWGGIRGGEFMRKGEAAHKSSDAPVFWDYDYENGTMRVTLKVDYYVGFNGNETADGYFNVESQTGEGTVD